MSFANLKKQSGSFAKIKERMAADKQGARSYKDDRFWSLTVKDGVGSAIIRFLPPSDGEEIPYVLRYDHAYQNPMTKKWFIENCPSTIGQPCPVCTNNSEKWNSGIESEQAIARKRKRQKRYYANVYIVDDPAEPANNGKVFIYKFGPKIFDKISDKINPEFADEEACDVFDLWNGANFRLRAHTVNGQRSYDKSTFDAPSALLDDDAELEKVYNAQHKLQDLVTPKEFKTYAELEARFNNVEGVTVKVEDHEIPEPVKARPQPVAQEVDDSDDIPFDTGAKAETPKAETSGNVDELLAEYEELLN